MVVCNVWQAAGKGSMLLGLLALGFRDGRL